MNENGLTPVSGPPPLPDKYPEWEKVKTDLSFLPKRMLQELQKAMAFIVTENNEERVVVIVRAKKNEFRVPVSPKTPMRLCIDFYSGRLGDIYSLYPLVLDDQKDPFFKETWLRPYDDLPDMAIRDPLSTESRKKLSLLLNQTFVWMIFVDFSDTILWARKVDFTKNQIKKNKEYATKLDRYIGKTLLNMQGIALLQEYMKAVPMAVLQSQFQQLFKE